MCSCSGTMCLDGTNYTYQSCDEEHIPWVSRICLEVLTKKIEEIRPVREKHMGQMRDLLRWKTPGWNCFMRDEWDIVPLHDLSRPGIYFERVPKFIQSNNGLTSWQVFHDHETLGVSLPHELEDPDNLLDLLQSKCLREFTITEWLDTYYNHRDEYPIWPEEYLKHPGMTKEQFNTLFGRDPEPDLIIE
jgi:hypothetical protein